MRIGTEMAETVRLSKKEQELLRKKCIEINKLLVSKEKAPLKDSELLHVLIENGVKCLEVDRNGNVFLPN